MSQAPVQQVVSTMAAPNGVMEIPLQSAFFTAGSMPPPRQSEGEEGGEDADDMDANGNLKRGWTAEEDDLLVRCVDAYGPRRWASAIAPLVPGRTGKQCRDR
jgi:hypothetical protein